jgi:hypothetical protein
MSLIFLLLTTAASAGPFSTCGVYEATTWTETSSANTSTGFNSPENITAFDNTGSTVGSVGGGYSTANLFKWKQAIWSAPTQVDTVSNTLPPRATGSLNVVFNAHSIFESADASGLFVLDFSLDGGTSWRPLFSDTHAVYGDSETEQDYDVTRTLYQGNLDPDQVQFRAYVSRSYHSDYSGTESSWVTVNLSEWKLTVCP